MVRAAGGAFGTNAGIPAERTDEMSSEARNAYFAKAMVLSKATKGFEAAGVERQRAQKEADLAWPAARNEHLAEHPEDDYEAQAAAEAPAAARAAMARRPAPLMGRRMLLSRGTPGA